MLPRLTLAPLLAAQGRLARLLRLRRPQARLLRRRATPRRPRQIRRPGQVRSLRTAGRPRRAGGPRASQSCLRRILSQRLRGCRCGRATCVNLGRMRTPVRCCQTRSCCGEPAYVLACVLCVDDRAPWPRGGSGAFPLIVTVPQENIEALQASVIAHNGARKRACMWGLCAHAGPTGMQRAYRVRAVPSCQRRWHVT